MASFTHFFTPSRNQVKTKLFIVLKLNQLREDKQNNQQNNQQSNEQNNQQSNQQNNQQSNQQSNEQSNELCRYALKDC